MPSDRPHKDKVQKPKNAIGAIFRKYGEQYIKIYKPPLDHIKFIRAVRICKSPGLGGKLIECKDCNHLHPIYFGCGHARCPICSAIKREQWMDKFSMRLLEVAYVHLVTTMPHYFNGLSRRYPKVMYDLLFRATQLTVWELCENPDHMGASPGMTSVLHTWGSDMKYHVHVHSLLTYGGMDEDGNWKMPKHNKRICRNSKLRSTFKRIFLRELKVIYEEGLIKLREDYEGYIARIKDKRWSLFVTHPTMRTEVIEKYLARYINRIAISNNRVEYVKHLSKVNVIYNDYKQQEEGQPAPKETKVMEPFSFIHQLLIHLPPPYYHRTRHYGLHANMKSKKTKELISKKARSHPRAIRTVMEILTHLMHLEPFVCQECGSLEYKEHLMRPDAQWIFEYITLPKIRSPVPA